MNRPAGVTVIAVLCFLVTAGCVLIGILLVLGGGYIATLIRMSDHDAAATGILAGLGALIGVVVLVFAVLYAVVGWGLLKLKEWARITTLVLAGLSILGGLIGLVGAFTHFSVFVLFWTVVRLAIVAWIIWYLLQPSVRAAFQGQARPATG
jgi:hypothetical protein